MKHGAQTAAAVSAGYLLGRTKKMRLALMIAAAGATGRLGTTPQGLLRGGLSRLSESVDVSKVTDSVRGEFLDAARSAVTKAATDRIEAWSDRLQNDPDDEPTADDSPQNEDSTDEPEYKPQSAGGQKRGPGTRRPSRADAGDDAGDESGGRDSGETQHSPDRTRQRTTASPPRTRARSSAGRSPVRRPRR